MERPVLKWADQAGLEGVMDDHRALDIDGTLAA